MNRLWRHREAWLTLGLVALLALITIAAAMQQATGTEAPPLASFSAGPRGAKALLLWLGTLGYEADTEPLEAFEPPEGAALALVLEPTTAVTEREWDVLDAWTRSGGTLLLAGEGQGVAALAGQFDFELRFLPGTATITSTQTPLLQAPPAGQMQVLTRRVLATERADFITHLAWAGRPVLVSFDHGEGQVILSATADPLTNAGLKIPGNPALVLNLISAASPDGAIWFDEWHHGIRSQPAGAGLGNWLRATAAGRALLFAAGAIFIALVLQGKSFGKPVRDGRVAGRRAPLEGITAVANLSRRAGHRQAVMLRYQHWLKRGLGARYRLDPTLPNDEYLACLAGYDPDLDSDALGDLLNRLQSGADRESDMVALAAEAADWLAERPTRSTRS